MRQQRSTEVWGVGGASEDLICRPEGWGVGKGAWPEHPGPGISC